MSNADRTMESSLSHRLRTSPKSLCILCLTLLLTPNLVALASLCLLYQVGATVALTSLISFGTSPEMMIAALLIAGIGMAVYLFIAILSAESPTLADMVAIELSQVFSFLMSIAALTHNPQEEFCKASAAASALAKAFQLDSCSLTIHFWMQVGVVGLIFATSFILIFRMGRSIIRVIFN